MGRDEAWVDDRVLACRVATSKRPGRHCRRRPSAYIDDRRGSEATAASRTRGGGALWESRPGGGGGLSGPRTGGVDEREEGGGWGEGGCMAGTALSEGGGALMRPWGQLSGGASEQSGD